MTLDNLMSREDARSASFIDMMVDMLVENHKKFEEYGYDTSYFTFDDKKIKFSNDDLYCVYDKLQKSGFRIAHKRKDENTPKGYLFTYNLKVCKGESDKKRVSLPKVSEHVETKSLINRVSDEIGQEILKRNFRYETNLEERGFNINQISILKKMLEYKGYDVKYARGKMTVLWY